MFQLLYDTKTHNDLYVLLWGEVWENTTSLNRHFSLKWMYQAMKVSGHVLMLGV